MITQPCKYSKSQSESLDPDNFDRLDINPIARTLALKLTITIFCYDLSFFIHRSYRHLCESRTFDLITSISSSRSHLSVSTRLIWGVRANLKKTQLD